jgi:hypothetical protein
VPNVRDEHVVNQGTHVSVGTRNFCAAMKRAFRSAAAHAAAARSGEESGHRKEAATESGGNIEIRSDACPFRSTFGEGPPRKHHRAAAGAERGSTSW